MAGMAMFTSNLSSEIGLKLLLSPLNTNVVVRTACCSVGIVLPVYSTFKAIEMGDQNEQRKWLLYWAVYGSFSIVEAFTDKFLYWFPLYYHVKLAFLVWLQLPSAEGAKQLYTNHLRPFLMRHQARLDHILELFHGELAKFISAHQTEIQYAKVLLGKTLLSVGNILQQPAQGRVVGTIEGPAEQVETSESEDES
ncbi:HVA22-like protein k [Capsicum baccatum]|uniref:HVA22-like protein n=2 Tax=Capsicum TaxID=4071 RepID=A0A1U8FXC4_CAPAN|nr:HVA22-like protein k [Capsicum annuum]XP_047262000.1 HVA22-like protein k [Capsicum annuum]XP_047262010.1 HVA22-like protein k [Capsicum annuum]PHT53686.1 HVA22-like protein k [Capsicum baccatum]KAF3665140.1 HVA22-like protein k [Capsicum annuum]PHT87919.1 HVA22-like protein k [Capsicum annuum]